MSTTSAFYKEFEQKIRIHLRMARRYYDEFSGHDEAEKQLSNTCSKDYFNNLKYTALEKEISYRLSIYEILDKSLLTPRQYVVMYLHYLEYKSWTEISKILDLSRRYTIQIHKLALERMFQNQDFLHFSNILPRKTAD